MLVEQEVTADDRTALEAVVQVRWQLPLICVSADLSHWSSGCTETASPALYHFCRGRGEDRLQWGGCNDDSTLRWLGAQQLTASARCSQPRAASNARKCEDCCEQR